MGLVAEERTVLTLVTNTGILILGRRIVVLYICKGLFKQVKALLDCGNLCNTGMVRYDIQQFPCIVQFMDEILILILLGKSVFHSLIGIIDGLPELPGAQAENL